MAHFAKIGMSSKVIAVLTLDNKDMLNADGVEDESVGQQYLERHNNWPAQMWIQTSYNTSQGKHKSGDDSKAFRGNYAGIGHIWDEDNNIFYPKSPYPSWVLNTTTASWHSPIGDAPELTAEQIADTSNRYHYDWNEVGQSWDLVTTPIPAA
jgi:hypothetical protein